MKHSRRALAIAAALLATALLPSGVSAAPPTPYNHSLLVNPGAEAGAGTQGYSSVEIPGWSPANGATVVKYGAPGFPTTAESERFAGRKKFFSCGPDGYGLINQQVRIYGRSAEIDAGHVAVFVRAWIATHDSETEVARVQVFPLLRSGSAITQWSTPSVTASNDVFQKVTFTQQLPPKTRGILIRLYTSNLDGPYCNGYFDKIDLEIRAI